MNNDGTNLNQHGGGTGNPLPDFETHLDSPVANSTGVPDLSSEGSDEDDDIEDLHDHDVLVGRGSKLDRISRACLNHFLYGYRCSPCLLSIRCVASSCVAVVTHLLTNVAFSFFAVLLTRQDEPPPRQQVFP
jgi:hypothetical protein